MGASRRACRAVFVAAVLCAGAPAGASVQVDPVARLSLEGGYDSNVLYNGQGGDSAGRVSPELGLHLRDHTWKLNLDAGGDLLMYPQRNNDSFVWNQRGRALLHARATERLTFDTDVSGTYAFDPIGLARLGIFNASGGAALVTNGKLRGEWRASPTWNVAGLFEEHLVRFDNATGAASHSPGVEATRRIGPRVEVGGVYKFDFFQGFGAGAQDAVAHEAAALVRYRAGRRLTLEASAGPAVWSGTTGGTSVLPEAMVQVLAAWRGGGARLSVRHGVGLGLTATPGLFDALEAGVMTRLGRSFEIHADGGLWRSGDIPWGSNSVLGYGIDTSFDYRIQREMLIGVGASRYARLDVSASQYDRYILGLHVTWELSHRRGEP
jgi:hypothetical protein